jgi:two-component system sensor histidine kinase AgrC
MTFIAVALISFLYKKDWLDAAIDYSVFLIVGFPLGFIMEFVIRILSFLNIKLLIDTNEYHHAIYMFILFLFSLMIYKLAPLKEILDNYRKFLRRFYLIIGNMFVFYFISKEDYIMNSNRNYILALSYFAVIILNIFLFKEFWSIKNRQNLIKQHNEYIKSIEPLIADIRSKQHDFKNHLTTLSNLSNLNDSQEDSITSYIHSINNQLNEIDNFVYSSNKVIGVLLYIKSCECSSRGIDFQYSHPCHEVIFPLEDFEFTSVLGNLLDNAIFAVEKLTADEKDVCAKKEKKVCVEMGEENGLKYFMVSNTGNPIPFNDIPKLFVRGYTTKENKKSHGYGLYNVKKIISNYNGMIDVTSNGSLVTFKISFS